MPIQHTCDGCGFTAWVDDTFAGRAVRCKKCQHRGQVPTFAIDFGNGSPAPIALSSRRRRKVGPATVGGIVLIPLMLMALAYVVPKLANLSADDGSARALGEWVGTIFGWSLYVVPLIGPAVLSRSGVGMASRWLIMSGFCLVAAGLCAVMALGTMGFAASITPVLFMAATVGFAFGIAGCLLGAAVAKPAPRAAP